MWEIVIFSAAILLRCLVGLWGHSGQGVPPMFGDFEAQRHWLEITNNVPIGDWYRDTPDNDLMYWGLDYPPLTAYVSWAFGRVAEVLHPPLVTLHDSRGLETNEARLFMRASVLLLDIIIFFPAVRHLSSAIQKKVRPQSVLSLIAPSLILIDHGHFQYNSTCIGLALWAVVMLDAGRYILASILFCLSLNFKQMALYYAPAFFFSLLGVCRDLCLAGQWGRGVRLFGMLATTVIASFGLLWTPFCALAAPNVSCLGGLGQVLHRLFPFSRGIFEDKVANLWYALSVVHRHVMGADIRDLMDTSSLAIASLVLTLLLLVPTSCLLANKGQRCSAKQMSQALTVSALAFFLGSFQVHEKSLLLALVPASLLHDSDDFALGAWFQCTGLFSMLPLLVKDALVVPACTCLGLYATLAAVLGGPVSPTHHHDAAARASLGPSLRTALYTLSYTLMGLVCVAWSTLEPPKSLPDLFPVLVALLSCANLCVAYAIYSYLLLVGDGVEELRPHMTRVREGCGNVLKKTT